MWHADLVTPWQKHPWTLFSGRTGSCTSSCWRDFRGHSTMRSIIDAASAQTSRPYLQRLLSLHYPNQGVHSSPMCHLGLEYAELPPTLLWFEMVVARNSLDVEMFSLSLCANIRLLCVILRFGVFCWLLFHSLGKMNLLLWACTGYLPTLFTLAVSLVLLV